MQIMMISTIFAGLVFPIVGKICDIVSASKIVPFAFFMRCFTCYLFLILKSPKQTMAYVICPAVVVSSVVEQISIDTIFAKNLPKETRGMLNGVYSFCGQLGIFIYSLVAGYTFDHFGSKSPFVIIALLDFFFGLFCVY